jgi:chromosome segregation protein
MRLQRLEIAGFKSFPDRADLAFDRGVTAIVGPNGCGKSNVVDAITWVLGEQSAKSLRGERMEDVIFSGSDARKATAAAEVRLRLSGVVTRPRTATPATANVGGSGNGHATAVLDGGGVVVDGFDLDDASLDEPPLARDVELARRLYRSGESEYLIDGHVCRLKDIQDLLMDVGIGVKGYAVIEQGKIGQILSSKPTDRRQLIEEAAGVTKYKSRRRAAELKLEAAQQNLTRIDDIIFELDKQRGALKRQAAKARRYRKLREELRQWEKLLFAQRYEVLGAAIHTARERLAQTREREALASARVGELESDLERLRIELTEADTRANVLRADAHNRELENERRQQQITFDGQQVETLALSVRDIGIELQHLDARRAPGLMELEARREAAGRADDERDQAAQALASEEQSHNDAQRDISGLEREVETARSAVFAKLNAETTLKHAIERAEEARNRIADDLARLDVEAADLRIEIDRLALDRERAAEDLRAAQESLEATHAARATSEAELGTARVEREWRVRDALTLERDVAATAARLKSLEELEAARAAYGDAARLVLASPDHGITHGGSVADYLEVDREYERIVEACFADLLQYVIVHNTADAARGLAFVRERNAGRCGFLIAEPRDAHGSPNPSAFAPAAESPAATFAAQSADWAAAPVEAPSAASARLALDAVVRVNGPYAASVRRALGEVLIVDTFDEAAALSAQVSAPVATKAGDVFRGGHLVTGGGRDEGHGILVTKREIKELREKLAADQISLQTLTDEVAALDATIAQAEQTIKAHEAERHRQEKSILQAELQVSRAKEELDRLTRRQELGANERRRFEDERRQLEERQEEARQSIIKLADEHRLAEAGLSEAQQQLFDGRERLAAVARRAGEAKAVHAALVERASAIANEVRRLEEAARELDARIAGRADERARMERRREELAAAIVENQRQLDQDLVAFGELRQQVVSFEERVNEVQIRFQEHEHQSRAARADLDAVRSEVTQLEVARATAEADLSHLAALCQEALQLTLDEVASEVAALTAAGNAIPAAPVAADEESAEGEEGAEGAEGVGVDSDSARAAALMEGARAAATRAADAVAAAAGGDALDAAGDSLDARAALDAASGAEASAAGAAASGADAASATSETIEAAKKERAAAPPMAPEDAIAMLKKKIDRLGPVNMMAIEQFDELETRHAFLTTQRKDLLDSIAQTGEAIKRIEKTTRERFHEAFTTINTYFGEMFTTLFGGGRAGLVLLDETDELESGIDIIAQPPGKRLQNVQLLSGGEKALTAMALMFGIFRYRPSPFCLLDEIDAPLDDANIGRFVEMLRGMNDHTQFILITHHRKTMEIADRLYGVTMEEPGVSKLISLELN